MRASTFGVSPTALERGLLSEIPAIGPNRRHSKGAVR